MAIKVNGTTVIDDSRNLVNIVSGAGASTTFGAVGTYTLAGDATYTASIQNVLAGGTFAGSGLTPISLSSSNFTNINAHNDPSSGSFGASANATVTLSGTWRKMTPTYTTLYMGGDTTTRPGPVSICVRTV